MRKKAAFFDRDGTIIKDVGYLSTIKDIQLLAEGINVARICQQQGYLLFIVTNQSGIARDYFDADFVNETHNVLKGILEQLGIVFVDYVFCPHHPDYTGQCVCRKPAPGMLTSLAEKYNLDLTKSLMFGDRLSDLQAGWASGCLSFDITKFANRSFEECATLMSSENKQSNEGMKNESKTRSSSRRW